jgi:hypothetical protein
MYSKFDIKAGMENRQITRRNVKNRAALGNECVWDTYQMKSTRNGFYNPKNAKPSPCITVFKAEPLRLAVDNTKVVRQDTKSISLKKAA